MNQAVRLWNEIFQIVKENCSTDYGEFLTGLSCHAIADRLTAFGIKTPGGKSKWSQSTVKSILKNEKYKDGYFDYVVPPLEAFGGRTVWTALITLISMSIWRARVCSGYYGQAPAL